MTTNQYLPFGTAGGANVLSPADYAALAARLAGFSAGVAQSEELNTVWRQASVIAAMIGQFVGDIGGFDALDDGSVANIQTSFERTIQGGKLNFAIAGGSANSITANLTPAPATYSAPFGIVLLLSATNTGAATLNVNGLGAKSILRAGGTALSPGDLTAGQIIVLVYDGTAFQIPSQKTPPALATTLYVRTDGNDANDGLTNSPSGAFATIQAAANTALTRYNAAGSSVVIQVGDGTYTAGLNLLRSGIVNITLQGNPSTPANCVINTSGDTITASIASRLVISGFRLLSSGGTTMTAFDGSSIRFSNIDFGATLNAHIFSAQNSFIVADGNYSVSGAAAVHALALTNSTISIGGRTITFTGGTQNYNQQFVHANNGTITADGMTFSGAGVVVGPRYLSEVSGLIYTAGAGANYLPGSIAGSTATNGLYI
ncbi:hypothetical protein [Rhizobium sp. No.120]